MALATRCPHCQASFRVVADQLKLRGGLVRCGTCRQVFDAIGSLTYVEDANAKSAPTEAAPAQQSTERAAPKRPTPAQPQSTDRAARPITLRIAPGAAPQPYRASAAPRNLATASAPDPDVAATTQWSVPTLLGAPGEATMPGRANPRAVIALSESELAAAKKDREPKNAPAPAARATVPVPPVPTPAREVAQVERMPPEVAHAQQSAAYEPTDEPADEATDEPADEFTAAPAFLSTDEPRRKISVIYTAGTALMSVVVAVQLAVMFRTELITRWPALRPTLVQWCAHLGCHVSWPMRAELLAVIGTELQAVPGTDVLELSAVIRNRANYRVALPAVEVTLTDTQNRPVARKVFAPVDYLSSSGEPSSRIDEGLGPGNDYLLRVVFEARGLNASGFVVYPFYL